jgi:hypothetical protein
MHPRTLLLALVTTHVVVPQSSLLDRSTPFEHEWRITRADHFDIAFTAATAADLERVATTADGAYRRLSAGLTHQLSLRPLIVVYGTRADLQRAIAARSFPGNREHLLWALDTPAAQVGGDFVHELTHIFAFDIVPPTARDLPTWLHEGLAEFERAEWSDSDRAFVGDLIRTNRLPALGGLSAEVSTGTERLQTIVWRLALDLLATRAGKDAVNRMLVSLRESPISPLQAYLTALGLTESQFDGEFQRYVRARFAV